MIGYHHVATLHSQVDRTQTLAENIADNGGIAIAYQVHNYIEGIAIR